MNFLVRILLTGVGLDSLNWNFRNRDFKDWDSVGENFPWVGQFNGGVLASTFKIGLLKKYMYACTGTCIIGFLTVCLRRVF